MEFCSIIITERACHDSLRCVRFGEWLLASVEISGDETQDLGRRICGQHAVSTDGAIRLIVDDDLWNGSKEADSGCEQDFGYVRGDDGKIGCLRNCS